jgi:uncharacterized protein (TIGR02246 family)
MTRTGLLVLAGVVLMATVSSATLAADDDALREIKDREEINKLMWDYARALDTGNAQAFAANFTEDGQFGRGANAVKGRDALIKMVGGFRKLRLEPEAKSAQNRYMYHMTANHHIEFIDKDHAVFHAYWIAFVSTTGQNQQPTIVGVGRELNELVRVKGKWLIRMRDITPQD